MVRTTLGAEVSTTVNVSGAESVDFIVATGSGSVPGGDTEVVTVRPPSGFIYELLSVNLRVDKVSSTASDIHVVRLQSESRSISVIQGNSDADKRIIYQGASFIQANDTQRPSATTAQTVAPAGLRADSSAGFQLEYINKSSQDHTSARRYKLWVRQIQVSD